MLMRLFWLAHREMRMRGVDSGRVVASGLVPVQDDMTWEVVKREFETQFAVPTTLSAARTRCWSKPPNSTMICAV
jgi:hypothetical protein